MLAISLLNLLFIVLAVPAAVILIALVIWVLVKCS